MPETSIVPTLILVSFPRLLKDNNGIAMWDHLVACINPTGHVDMVKKNLQL